MNSLFNSLVNWYWACMWSGPGRHQKNVQDVQEWRAFGLCFLRARWEQHSCQLNLCLNSCLCQWEMPCLSSYSRVNTRGALIISGQRILSTSWEVCCLPGPDVGGLWAHPQERAGFELRAIHHSVIFFTYSGICVYTWIQTPNFAHHSLRSYICNFRVPPPPPLHPLTTHCYVCEDVPSH